MYIAKSWEHMPPSAPWFLHLWDNTLTSILAIWIPNAYGCLGFIFDYHNDEIDIFWIRQKSYEAELLRKKIVSS